MFYIKRKKEFMQKYFFATNLFATNLFATNMKIRYLIIVFLYCPNQSYFANR